MWENLYRYYLFDLSTRDRSNNSGLSSKFFLKEVPTCLATDFETPWATKVSIIPSEKFSPFIILFTPFAIPNVPILTKT